MSERIQCPNCGETNKDNFATLANWSNGYTYKCDCGCSFEVINQPIRDEIKEFKRVLMKEAIEPWALPIVKWLNKHLSRIIK